MVYSHKKATEIVTSPQTATDAKVPAVMKSIIRRLPLVWLMVSLGFSACALAQSWQGILDPTRAIDWTQAGVPGGIPNRAVCTTIQASTYGNGSSDATSGIQTALNDCATNQAVALSAGTFRINGSLSIPSNRVLRGAGANQTILDLHGNGSYAIHFGSDTSPNTNTSNTITAGATQGSNSITVSGSGISVGQLLMISQNDTSYMTPVGSDGTCDWCDGGWPGNMDSGQIVEVTTVNGSTIGFRPPLYMDYSANNPRAYRFSVGAKNAGLESLQLYANNTGYQTNIMMQGTEYCWIKDVESNFADGDHMMIYFSMGNEVRDSYFHDGFSHSPGSTDDDLVIALKSSANLIVNNIFYRQHASIMLEWGAAGNVIAYNTSTGNYHDSDLQWFINDFNFHGAHPWFNLFEGNVGDKFQADSIWGSSSHNTVFRNWFRGSRQYVPPQNGRGALQPTNAQWENQNTFAYSIDFLSQFNNMVGNISGSSHLQAQGAVNMKISPASGGGNPACYRFGYDSETDAAVSPNNAYNTAFMHGNYDCVAGTFQWDSNHTDHTLPPSFFLSSKPAWFGSVPWPAIGPDVSGGTGPGGFTYRIPAQLCFENAAKDGTGRPIFDPVACYGDQNGPAPPDNVTATPH